ncbi:MAG: UDP-N-acetylmuramoyl-L-alanine--D-glutamate ligase [Campylobacter sp.]|nr:UDP-N-acetylmuramoyl-L-alanine--D-glutamate ligase [Campylobacter sp.]
MKKSLFGYGGTTKAIAKSGGWDIYDDNFENLADDKSNQTRYRGGVKFDEFGNALLNPRYFDPEKSKLEIPSPGFPPYHELIKKAKNLISEYDYFGDYSGLKIWISGTNGKTTTTKMLQHQLKRYGSQMGGNVGVPLANLDKNAKIWVLETSSFTMHYTLHAKPDIYVLLPITADHLSWHGDFAEYEKAKLKPLGMMNENGVAILPKIYTAITTKAHVIAYENEADLAKFCGISVDEVKFKIPFLTDALLALAVEKILFDKCDVALLNRFVIESNKLEEFNDAYGRVWVNDTKATNIDACVQALKRYAEYKMHLILGGDDKGVDLHPLFNEFKKYDLQIYAIGVNADKIAILCDEYGVRCVCCEILQTAVSEISKRYLSGKFSENLDANFGKTPNGEPCVNLKDRTAGVNASNPCDFGAKTTQKHDLNDTANLDENKSLQKSCEAKKEIALLCHACASLDQFKSYAERGDLFKKFVGDL